MAETAQILDTEIIPCNSLFNFNKLEPILMKNYACPSDGTMTLYHTGLYKQLRIKLS